MSENQVEPGSWWLLVALTLGAIGGLALLTVHLVLEAADVSPWLWTLMAVPGVFFAAGTFALMLGSGIPMKARLATIPAALLGYSPPERRT
jgi:hypothetical protein